MRRYLMLLGVLFIIQACSDSKEYELKKFYKDPESPAAKIVGSTYAGVVATLNSMSACMQMKEQAEVDDLRIGYTNSRFVCDEK